MISVKEFFSQEVASRRAVKRHRRHVASGNAIPYVPPTGMAVKNANGNTFTAGFSVKDSDGNAFTVTASVKDSDGNSFTVI
jgi:hypothetical protein